jgi:hypothetical protein
VHPNPTIAIALTPQPRALNTKAPNELLIVDC